MRRSYDKQHGFEKVEMGDLELAHFLSQHDAIKKYKTIGCSNMFYGPNNTVVTVIFYDNKNLIKRIWVRSDLLEHQPNVPLLTFIQMTDDELDSQFECYHCGGFFPDDQIAYSENLGGRVCHDPVDICFACTLNQERYVRDAEISEIMIYYTQMNKLSAKGTDYINLERYLGIEYYL